MRAMDRAIVTGAAGFVGRALCDHLEAASVRLHMHADDWREQIGAAAFSGATVFHLAARVHDPDSRDEAAFERDNVEKTRELARSAAAGGARRLVFASTIKVNGEETRERPFSPSDPPAPEDAYARSKWAAEQALADVARASGLEVAIVRSPLVYGSAVKGNLLALLRIADSPWPLPLGAIDNRRSFVHVDDLARLLIDCATLPEAAGGTFFAAHAEPVSTSALVRAMRRCLNRPDRLAGVPPSTLEALAALTGQRERMRRLTRSLEVDASQTTQALGWSAQIGFETAVEDMVRTYVEASAE